MCVYVCVCVVVYNALSETLTVVVEVALLLFMILCRPCLSSVFMCFLTTTFLPLSVICFHVLPHDNLPATALLVCCGCVVCRVRGSVGWPGWG